MRRAKALVFPWVRIPPGGLVILAGSSSSGLAGDFQVEASSGKGSVSDSASVRAVTRVNVEQAPKTTVAGADPPELQGKAKAIAYRGNDPPVPDDGPAGVMTTARRKRKPA